MKFLYDPLDTQEKYELILRDSRIGLDIAPEDKEILDRTLENGVSRGQSIHHVVEANKEDLRYSERSIYRLIKNGQCSVKPIDLRRMVKLKQRKHYIPKEDNKRVRIGRTYADYIAFLAQNPLVHSVQMDTVESIRRAFINVFLPFSHPCILC